MRNFKPKPSGEITCFSLAAFEMLHDNMSAFNAACIHMYAHLEININIETRHLLYQNEKKTSTLLSSTWGSLEGGEGATF